MPKENYPRYLNGKDMWHNSQEFDDALIEYRRTGDKVLRDRLIAAHLPLVTSVANHYTGYLKSRGSLELGDLIQEGSIGLMTAMDADHYDPNMEGRNFYAYATMWIRQSVLRVIAEKNKTIRLPVNQVIKSDRLRTETEIYQKTYGRKPTIEQLAEITSMPVEEIIEVSQYSEPISIDIKYKDDGDEERGARAVDYRAQEAKEKNEKRESAKYSLDEMIRKTNSTKKTRLTSREEEMYYMRYGLNGFLGHRTEEELAEEYKITHQRVHQILQKIKRKIRIANGLIPPKEKSAKS